MTLPGTIAPKYRRNGSRLSKLESFEQSEKSGKQAHLVGLDPNPCVYLDANP